MVTSVDSIFWQRVSPYLDRALELDPHEREAWLVEITATDPDLAGKLRTLLTDLESMKAGGFLESSPVTSMQVGGIHEDLQGKLVGGYTIDRLLGRGGMGEVWLASRSDGRFEGQCAIKFLDRSIVNASVIDRFRREGKLLARLAHPHIARLLDAGTDDGGRPYLVIEYVDGENIESYCKSHSLSTRARVQLYTGVVAAVAHAHANLIIHRDLKPSNVLVTRDGVVKLLDFGVAKLLRSETSTEDTVTRVEDAALTPDYAAPEQLLGELPSTATDVYQLGMLLYVLLTERHPARRSGNRAERVKAALEERVPRASEFAAQHLRKELTGDLDAILAVALRKENNERYATAAALGEDLNRFLERQPIVARRDSVWYRTRKFASRNKPLTAAVMIALLAVVGGGLASVWNARIANQERERALELASRNAAINEFTEMLISDAATSDAPISIHDLLIASEKLALADTSSSPENRSAILSVIANRYHVVNDTTKAIALLDTALALLVDTRDIELKSSIVCDRAWLTARRGDYKAARRAVDQELDRLESIKKSSVSCLADRVFFANDEGDGEGQIHFAREALQALSATRQATPNTEAVLLDLLASGYRIAGQNDQADRTFAEAMRRLTAIGRSSSDDAMNVLNNWAFVNINMGRPKRALELLDQVSLHRKQKYANSPPSTSDLLNRSRMLEVIGRFDEARPGYELCRDSAQQLHQITQGALCLLGLASMSLQLQDLSGAGRYLDQTEQLAAASLPPDAPSMQRLALLRGELEVKLGHFDEAQAQFARALPKIEKSLGTIDTSLAKAEADLLQGNISSALANAQKARDVAEFFQSGSPYSNRTGLVWLMFGRIFAQQGNDDQARKAFETAIAHLSNTVDDNHPALVEARRLASSH